MDIRFDILTEDGATLTQSAPVHLNALDAKIREIAHTLKPASTPPRQDSIKSDLINLNKTTLERLIKKYEGSFNSSFDLFYFFLLSLTTLRKSKELSTKEWLEKTELLASRLKVQKDKNRHLVFSFFFSLVEEKLLEIEDCEKLLSSLLKIEEKIRPQLHVEGLKAAIKALVYSDNQKNINLFEKIILALDDKEEAFIPLFSEKLTLLDYLEYLNAKDSFTDLLKDYGFQPVERKKLPEKDRLLFLDACKRHDLYMLAMLLEEGVLAHRLFDGRKAPLFAEIYDKKFLTPQMLSLFLKFGLPPSMYVAENSSQSFWKYCIDLKKVNLTEVLLAHEACLDDKILVPKIVDFTPYAEEMTLFEYALVTRSYEVASLFATHLKAETLSQDPGILEFVASLLEEEKEEKEQLHLQLIVDALSIHLR